MKKYLLAALLLLSTPVIAGESVNFSDYFIDKTMRIDYVHTGDAKEEFVAIDTVYQQGIWAGSLTNLIDDLNLGRYYIKIYDFSSDRLIFSKGFDSYFGEYKTTDDSLKGIKRSYYESALIPFPKNKIRFVIEFRNRKQTLKPIFSREIDPSGININKEPLVKGVKVFNITNNGAPHRKIDLAVIAEGYTAAEGAKVKSDLDRFARVFFNQQPYKSLKGRFNVYGVFKASQESGCDEPSHGVFKNTAIGATFDSLGSERYLMTEDNRALRDIAAHAPYDALIIMVNHKRYGGGGIYNLFSVFTADNYWHDYLLLHEFGHAFAGLADEYYTSATSYNDFYPRGTEPLEPNISALRTIKKLKWKALASPSIDIPTPWEKDDFDKMDLAYQKVRQELNKQIAAMKRSGAPRPEVAKLEERSENLARENAKKVQDYLFKGKYYGKVGAFEGAGYSSKGLYRPMTDCIMFSKGAKPFCKVCEGAIGRVIKSYCE